MRQWVRIFCLKQTVACERKAGREGFPYSFTELCLCPRHRTHLKGLLRERHVLLQFTWAGLRWPRFCVPSAGGVHRSSTVLTLSNRHSWLAFPSHSRKYRSLLFSCTTASMHFPERMWTIIPFWKERRKKNKEIEKISRTLTISQQRKKYLKFVLVIKRMIKALPTGLIGNWSILATL